MAEEHTDIETHIHKAKRAFDRMTEGLPETNVLNLKRPFGSILIILSVGLRGKQSNYGLRRYETPAAKIARLINILLKDNPYNLKTRKDSEISTTWHVADNGREGRENPISHIIHYKANRRFQAFRKKALENGIDENQLEEFLLSIQNALEAANFHMTPEKIAAEQKIAEEEAQRRKEKRDAIKRRNNMSPRARASHRAATDPGDTPTRRNKSRDAYLALKKRNI